MSSPEPPVDPPVEAPVAGASKPNEPTPVLPSGIEAGLVGGFAVALVYAIRDAWVSEAFHTPSVLGIFLLEGADATIGVESALGPAIVYHTLHFTLWVIAGGVAGWMMNRVEESPRLWFLPWLAVAAGLVVIFWIDRHTVAAGLPRFHLWLGAIVGIGAMALFFQWRHPHAMGRVRSFGRS